MSAFTKPRAPVIDAAIGLAREFCAGYQIDGSPALGHAVKVARKVDQHLPTASPDLLAAVVVHDAPFFAPDEIDLDEVLTVRLGREVTRIVRAIEAEHLALEADPVPQVSTADLDALVASAADKVVSIAAILKRGAAARMPATFWVSRQPFIERVPYFEAFADQAKPFLPRSLAVELSRIVAFAAASTRPYAPTR